MTDLFVPGTPIGADSPTSPESCWATPQWLVRRLRDDVFEGVIGLDPCTTDANPVGAGEIFTPTTDGLKSRWPQVGTIYVNPPFIDSAKWAQRCLDEAGKIHRPHIVFLGPAAIGTKWLHHLWERCDDALFLNKRIRFEGVCVFKLGEKPNRRACCLGPDAHVHDKDHPEYHRYTEGSPTRGTALFALNCSLEKLADLGTIARAIAA